MLRRFKRLPAWFIGALLLGPVFLLLPASFLDSGAEGRLRVSFFSIAITLLDPFVWTCAWNSVVVASLTTSLSAVGGIWIGRIVVKQGFAANGLMLFLVTSGLAIPPMYAALGFIQLFTGVVPASPLGWNANWLILILAGVCNGVSLVALITAVALRGIDPLLEDSARLAGATPRKIWRKIVWPVARPELARALSLIFAMSLMEPGAPSLLGLRRTLGFQLIQSARESALIGRAASITVLALGIAALGRLLIGWWGGNRAARSTAFHRGPRLGDRRPSWPGLLRLFSVFAIVFVLSGLPFIGLTRGFERETLQASPDSPAPWAAIVDEPWIRNAVVNAGLLGMLVVVLDLAGVKLVTTAVSEPRTRERLIRLARQTETIPPIVFGMGLLVIPEVLRMFLGFPSENAETGSTAGSSLGAIVDILDPRSGSWLPLAWSVAAARFSLVARSRIEDSLELRPACLDASRLVGASASRRPSVGWGGVSIASIVLTFGLAANTIAPALLLAPTAESRPIGPTILKLGDAPRPGRGIASALAMLGIGLNLGAFALISRELKTRPREPL